MSSKWARGTGGPSGDEAGTLIAFHATQDPIAGSVAPAMGTGNEAGCSTLAVAYTEDGEVAHTLRGTGFDASEDGTGRETPLVVAFQERGREAGRTLEHQEDLAYSLNAPAGGGRHQEMNIQAGMVVRRLTPTECLRLMALPDDWLDLDPPLSDSAKYRLCGNSIVVHCVAWIARRLLRVATGQPAEEGD